MSRFAKPSLIDGFGLKSDGSRPERGELVAIPFGDTQTFGIFVGHTTAGVDWIAYEASKFAGLAERFDLVEAKQAAAAEALATVNSEYFGSGEMNDEEREDREAAPLRIQSSIRVYRRLELPTWIPEDEGGIVDSLAEDFTTCAKREALYSEDVALLAGIPTATVAELVAWSKTAELSDGSVVALCDASGREELYAFWDGWTDNMRLDVFNPYEDSASPVLEAFARDLEQAGR
jgi:hypothetical protein